MSKSQQDTFICPHCNNEGPLTLWNNINVDKNPEMREKIQDLSFFEWTCPNCAKVSLVLRPCLYHDMANEFMVWLSPNGEEQAEAGLSQLSNYTLRNTVTPNEFREKINILARHLDDRAVELTKLILIMQLSRDDVDAVDLVFHDVDDKGNFVFVIVHPDGAEQFLKLPPMTYEKLATDVRDYIYTPKKGFLTIDLKWAKETLTLLKER